MTDKSQPGATSGLLGITGGMQQPAKIGQIVAFWRELVEACNVEALVADRVEASLWQLTLPETGDSTTMEEQAIALIEAALGGANPHIALWAEDAAGLCIEEGNLDGAARLLAEADRIYTACALRARINRADTLRARGQRLFRAGKFAEAKDPLDAALKAYRHLSTDGRFEETAETAYDLAVACTKLEGVDAGYVDGLFELAAHIFEAVHGTDCRQRVECLRAYGEYELSRGEAHYAAIHLRKALAALRRWETRDEALEAEVLRALGTARGN